MSNVKISALPDGGALQDTDELIAARAGGNVKILGSALGGGGGSQPDPSTFGRALYGGDAVTLANGAQGYMTWDTLGAGDALLDLSVAWSPAVVAGGIYSVTVVVNARFASFTAGGIGQAILHMDADNEDAICEQTFDAGNADFFPTVSLNNTYYIPAGGEIRVEVVNWDGSVSRDFRLLEAIVQIVVPEP